MSEGEIDLLDAARQLQSEMNAEGQTIGALIVGHLVGRLGSADCALRRVEWCLPGGLCPDCRRFGLDKVAKPAPGHSGTCLIGIALRRELKPCEK